MLFAIYDQDATPEHGGGCAGLDPENFICTIEADSAELAIKAHWEAHLTDLGHAGYWEYSYKGCRCHSRLNAPYSTSPGGWQCAIELDVSKTYGFLNYCWGGEYIGEFEISGECVLDCSHQGPCDDDVAFWLGTGKLATGNIDAEKLRKELADYGAWDDSELADHEQNLARLVWVVAGAIRDSEQPNVDFLVSA